MLLLSKQSVGVVGTAFITIVTLGGSRHDYSNWVGFKFTVGAKSLTISALGKWILPGNVTPFQVGIFDPLATTGPTPQVSTTIDPTLTAPGNFGWSAPLATPFTAAAGSSWVVAMMPVGTEDWLNQTVVSSTADATVTDATYWNGTQFVLYAGAVAYGVTNFKYTLTPPWTPNTVADIVLEADSITGLSDGASVLSWPGTGKNTSYSATYISGYGAPIYKSGIINGKPVVRFNSQLLQVKNVATDGNLSMFLVGRLNTAGNYPIFCAWDGDIGSNAWCLICGLNNSVLYFNPNGAIVGQSADGVMINWHVAAGIYNAALTTGQLFIDGTSVGSANSTPVAATGKNIWLGTRSDGYPLNDGDIAAVIMVCSNLSDSDRQKLEGYLANKYGLTSLLPAGHPYKNAPP